MIRPETGNRRADEARGYGHTQAESRGATALEIALVLAAGGEVRLGPEHFQDVKRIRITRVEDPRTGEIVLTARRETDAREQLIEMHRVAPGRYSADPHDGL